MGCQLLWFWCKGIYNRHLFQELVYGDWQDGLMGKHLSPRLTNLSSIPGTYTGEGNKQLGKAVP